MHTCLYCNTVLKKNDTKFCSRSCVFAYRRNPHPNGLICLRCNKPLAGRQAKYCSRNCSSRTTGTKWENDNIDLIKSRKETLISKYCAVCQQLCPQEVRQFHHLNGYLTHTPVSRLLSNRRITIPRFKRELDRCIVVCSACHLLVEACILNKEISLEMLTKAKEWATQSQPHPNAWHKNRKEERQKVSPLPMRKLG